MDKLETAIAVFPNHDAAEGSGEDADGRGLRYEEPQRRRQWLSLRREGRRFLHHRRSHQILGLSRRLLGRLLGPVLRRTVPGHAIDRTDRGARLSRHDIASAIENAVVVGGVAALGAALYSIGVPKDSVLHYESAIKADSFLVMARGAAEEIARAKTILGATNPSRLDIHRDADAVAPAASPAPVAA